MFHLWSYEKRIDKDKIQTQDNTRANALRKVWGNKLLFDFSPEWTIALWRCVTF